MALNVNEATKEELEALPGVGSATADKLMKARPIADGKELGALIPPSAWLKIQKEGVEFAYDSFLKNWISKDSADNKVEEPRPKGDERTVQDLQKLSSQTLQNLTTDEAHVTTIVEVVKMMKAGEKPTEMRRLMPGQELKAGAEYLCVWNAKHGPHGEAWVPEDAPVQAEIEGWFQSKGMVVKFAHYGPSIRLGTANRGMVNLVLFEIMKKEEDKDGDGNGSGRREGD